MSSDPDILYESINSNIDGFKPLNPITFQESSKYSDLEKHLIGVIEYLYYLEKVLCKKSSELIKNIEKNTLHLNQIISKKICEYESALLKNKVPEFSEQQQNEIMSIDTNKADKVFGSATKFCKRLDKWFDVENLIFNKVCKQRIIIEETKTIPRIEKTIKPNYVNEEILVTMHNNPDGICYAKTNNIVKEFRGVTGVAKSPYWPIIEQIDSKTYFFYGGIINRKPVRNCYFVSMENPLNFVEKRDYFPRSYASAAKYQDYIYVFGGSNNYLGDDNEIIKDCSKYSILNDTWSTIAPLSKPAYKNSSSYIFNNIYLAGNNFQYILEYMVNENVYTPRFPIVDCEMLLLADRWIIKRDSPDLIEITKDSTKTHRMKNYWNNSKWKNLEFQSNVFKRGNYIFLVEHVINQVPKIFRLDTLEKDLICIDKN